MSADSFAYIGKTHHICQDHALAGVTADLAYAIVSDGCSSSPDTDFGSWALARSTVAELLDDADGAVRGAFDGRRVIHVALGMAMACHTHPTSLDATLLVVVQKGNSITVDVWGDGVVLLRKRDGFRVVFNFEFEHGAPSYLSYILDPQRAKVYERETLNGKGTWTSYTESASGWSKLEVGFETTLGTPFHQDLDASEYDLVGVASDGMNSFQVKSPNGTGLNPVPLLDVVQQVFTFKGAFTGEFVTRRMRRFQKDMLDKGWQHADDVSIAVLHVAPIQ